MRTGSPRKKKQNKTTGTKAECRLVERRKGVNVLDSRQKRVTREVNVRSKYIRCVHGNNIMNLFMHNLYMLVKYLM